MAILTKTLVLLGLALASTASPVLSRVGTALDADVAAAKRREDIAQDFANIGARQELNPEMTQSYPNRGRNEEMYGCYTSGLKFSELHGKTATVSMDEVKSDIYHTCDMATPLTITFENRQSDWWGWCSEWETKDGSNGGRNHIYWEIQRGDSSSTHGAPNDPDTINYDECVAIFTRELDCEMGATEGEDSEGPMAWWIRIDPNAGQCYPLQATVTAVAPAVGPMTAVA